MDTPERNQIGTPVSKFEESPFSCFINNLSPINPIPVHVPQTFGSLSFTSPPSVFTSPHVNLQKEHKFLRRHQVSEFAKQQFPLNEGENNSIVKEVTNAEHQTDVMEVVQVTGEAASDGESSVRTLEDGSECAEELPRVLIHENVSPRSKTVTSSGAETISEPGTSAALVQYVGEPSIQVSFGTELNSQEMNQDNEEASCDWQSLIANSSDLFVFDSPNDLATSKDSLQKSQDVTNVYASLSSRFPADDAYGMLNSRPVGSSSYDEVHVEHSTQPTEAIELKQMDQPSENLEISSANKLFPGEKPGKEATGNLNRGVLRRCLTFEMPKTKKSMDGVQFSSSISSSQHEEKPLLSNKQPITPATNTSRHLLPNIGLHLNALATSKDCRIPNQQTLSSNNQNILVNPAVASLGNEGDPAENAEDSSHLTVYEATDELYPNSPKNKRRKFETTGEGESCKRCNCKKSKCLKLYCECFAAGVYCVEPCSCQDCFNKPIHEETVLATRKQIESRNPLAFAPKVIRTTDSAEEVGEDSTRTPASARHKRGCNCKKSNCLKKYCECYQGGVGCSINCRCEGCKNAFGRKDGSIIRGTESKMVNLQAPEKHATHKSSDIHEFHNDKVQNSEFSISQTPSKLYRQSAPLATSSKGKPPRSSLATTGSSSTLHPIDGPGRSTFLRTQSRIEKHYQDASADEIPTVLQHSSPPSNGLKTSSPKSKRVSPPHHEKGQSVGLKSSRKLILQSIPAFPSLSPRR